VTPGVLVACHIAELMDSGVSPWGEEQEHRAVRSAADGVSERTEGRLDPPYRRNM
jgi:hypothetical protein